MLCARALRCKPLQTCGFRSTRNTNTSFKRISTTTTTNTTTATMGTVGSQSVVRSQKAVGYWFVGCAGTVVCTVALGGLTRLTKSGLSMTDWHIVKGMKPPVTHEEWEEEFERYKQFPEYQLARQDMTLGEFKFIFNMEYYHRMLGRTVGLTFYLPAAYFWSRGYFSATMKMRVAAFGSLILGQGLFGWYMVKSGLKEETCANTGTPRVSQYRLATHLGLAFTVYSGLIYNGLRRVFKDNPIEYTKEALRLKRWVNGTLGLVFITAVSGAFVAGLEAGLVYNSFPRFADRWIPEDIAAINPWWKNMFENPTTTQFNHRVLGVTTFSSIVAVLCAAHPVSLPSRARVAVYCLGGMACLQVAMGVSTLLLYVPTELACAHQLGSLTLLTIALWLRRELRTIKIPKGL